MSPCVGGPADPMHSVDGRCLFSPWPGAPRCTSVAVTHLMVLDQEHGMVTLAACGEHEWVARAAGLVLLEHPHEPVCGWPGSIWLQPENRCVLDDSGVSRVSAAREYAEIK